MDSARDGRNRTPEHGAARAAHTRTRADHDELGLPAFGLLDDDVRRAPPAREPRHDADAVGLEKRTHRVEQLVGGVLLVGKLGVERQRASGT